MWGSRPAGARDLGTLMENCNKKSIQSKLCMSFVLEEILGNHEIKSTFSVLFFLNFCTADSRFYTFAKYTGIWVFHKDATVKLLGGPLNLFNSSS
jgi:hypothetical protein